MFRINLYLQIDKFLKGLFSFYKTNYLCDCSKILKKQSKKKNIFFTSQCRIAFLYILKFLKIINPKKKEIVFVAYNLPEMVNVAKNLNYKKVKGYIEGYYAGVGAYLSGDDLSWMGSDYWSQRHFITTRIVLN